ncbi:MAG: hypothetical protein IPL61_39905 [Myxococcales bacterium]|nr:hypothetical protein [Myxococcales bacterium]
MPPGSRQIEMTWRCSSCGHGNLGRHKVCQACGDPKDQGEKYEMPGDTAAAPTVTDAALVRMATAGPDWRCAYCGSDQRRLDDACGRCGASISEAVREHAIRGTPPTGWQRRKRWLRRHRTAVIVASVGLALVLGYLWVTRARTYQATVAAVRWEHTITVERYQIWDREGWRQEQPAAAFEVRSLGDKVHHYDDVLDGYDTEHYTEQVACGQDCVSVPESCSERCSDNGNGFATCTTSCTGGGTSCSTRYCSEDRTRQVPRYRKEPRYAEAIAYRIWDWGEHRAVAAAGAATTELRWPVEEARVGADLAPKQQERERRSARYVVTLAYDGAHRIGFTTSAEAFAQFALGTRHRLRVKGRTIAVDGQRVERAAALVPAEAPERGR